MGWYCGIASGGEEAASDKGDEWFEGGEWGEGAILRIAPGRERGRERQE